MFLPPVKPDLSLFMEVLASPKQKADYYFLAHSHCSLKFACKFIP